MKLNPLHTLEKQLYEVLSLHRGMRREAARGEILNCLDRVGIRQAAKRLTDYPHQLSGGERQRIGIARAFLHDCPVIFLDEPTSNIDSLNESIILKSLYTEKQGKQILLVSHRKSTMAIADTVIEMN